MRLLIDRGCLRYLVLPLILGCGDRGQAISSPTVPAATIRHDRGRRRNCPRTGAFRPLEPNRFPRTDLSSARRSCLAQSTSAPVTRGQAHQRGRSAAGSSAHRQERSAAIQSRRKRARRSVGRTSGPPGLRCGSRELNCRTWPAVGRVRSCAVARDGVRTGSGGHHRRRVVGTIGCPPDGNVRQRRSAAC